MSSSSKACLLCLLLHKYTTHRRTEDDDGRGNQFPIRVSTAAGIKTGQDHLNLSRGYLSQLTCPRSAGEVEKPAFYKNYFPRRSLKDLVLLSSCHHRLMLFSSRETEVLIKIERIFLLELISGKLYDNYETKMLMLMLVALHVSRWQLVNGFNQAISSSV